MKNLTFKQIKEVLGNFTIGIAGAGGLGSNCAVALVRSGIKKIVIADFDIVEESNLNRQYYFSNQIGMLKVDAIKDNLLSITREIEIDTRNIKLDADNICNIFKHCDIIVEAFDSAEMKQMLIENISEAFPSIPIIIGNGMAGWGNSNALITEQFGNIYACGDQKSEISYKLPPLAPRVGIVANMQANQVLEILLNKENNANSTK